MKLTLRPGRRFWLTYTLAWLPYAVGYAAVFLADRGESATAVALTALINVAAAAVVGIR